MTETEEDGDNAVLEAKFQRLGISREAFIARERTPPPGLSRDEQVIWFARSEQTGSDSALCKEALWDQWVNSNCDDDDCWVSE